MNNIMISLYAPYFVYIIHFLIIFNIILFIFQFGKSVNKYFLLREINLAERYGKNSYVAITGASSGQGKEFAIQFAKRGFNLLLIGSPNVINTKREIQNKYSNCIVKIITVNFCNAYKPGFFNIIENKFKKLDICILINNVGHRYAWNPYHEMPRNKINDIITCGTIVQSQLTRLIIPELLKREKKSGIIFVTAQCVYSNYLINFNENILTLPYLSVYEGANIFGYAHATSIYEEYKNQIDILNITPGAVITENTKEFLNDTMFKVNSTYFINSIMKLIGNTTGTTCGCWQHSFSLFIISIFPFIKRPILNKVGLSIANYYKSRDEEGELQGETPIPPITI